MIKQISEVAEALTNQKRRLLIGLVLCIAFGSVGCNSAETQDREFDGGESSGKPEVKRNVKPQADAEAAVIETDFGQIVIELYPNIAPKMVERFKKLISEGFYNGTTFHRIEPRAGVIQGGDPNSRDADPENDGMGGSDDPDLPAELSDVPYERGAVGAARSGAYDSANSQFFITLQRVPQWDGEYTVFGRVIRGMSDASIISTAPVRAGTTNPDPPIIIKRITLQPRANF